MKRCAHFSLARAFGVASLLMATACGGGDNWPDSAAPSADSPAFVLGYDPLQSPVFPAGTITVSPPNGRMTISSDGPVRVELELTGFPVQRLDRPNFQPKDNPQLKYVFGLPQALAPESRVCVVAKLTVTSVTGAVGLTTFGFCAGVGLGLEA